MARPRVLGLLARLILPKRDREFVLGDLDELYARRVTDRGWARANMAYVRDVLASLVAWRRREAMPVRRRAISNDTSSRFSRGVADDARLAVRSLRRQPRLTLVIVLTLALGIGPVAAVFGMVNQLILRPLPGAPNTHRAAYLQFGEPGRGQGLSLPDFDELRTQATLTDGLASYGNMPTVISVDGGRPLYVTGATVYGDYFAILGARASAGRLLTAADTDLSSNSRVIVLSESLRDRLFGADADVVGRTVTLNDEPVEVIGVAGDGFRGAERSGTTEAWVPFGALASAGRFTEERLRSRESAMHSSLLVLPRSGVNPHDLEQQVAAILARQAEVVGEDADYLLDRSPRVYPGLHMSPLIRDSTNSILGMMTWAVALILAIACANAANLLLFRNLTRRGSFATLRALGASTRRLARQQVTESLVLGIVGGSGGIMVAWLITLMFRGEQLVMMPAFESFTLGWETAAFVAALTITTALLFGVVPALLAGRFDLSGLLQKSRARETGRIGALRTALCAGQVSLTVALVVGGLLMVRTMSNLRGIDTGLDLTDVYSSTLIFQAPSGTPADNHARHRSLLQAVDAIPGVERAALDVYGPQGSAMAASRVGIPGAIPADGELQSRTLVWLVSPGWFDVFGVMPVAGRVFVDDDWRVPSGGGAVVTSSLARRIFGSADAVGRPLWVQGAQPPERTIIGVVGDYVFLGAPERATDAVFLPHGDLNLPFQLSLLTKVDPSVGGVDAAIRSAVGAIFPTIPVPESTPLSDRVDSILREERMLGRLFGILSFFGATMSALGLYAAIYYIVSSRRRELGIRVALGATGLRIVRLVAVPAFGIVAGGTVIGLLAAYVLAGLLRSWVFGVESLDPASYVGATLLLSFVAAAACIAPARAALAADPVATLREE